MTDNKKTTALFLLPWIVTMAVFWIYPFVYSFYLSFTEYHLIAPEASRWVGLANYFALLDDPVFLTALKNTFIFVVGTIPFTTVFAILLAVLLNTRIRFRAFYRSAFFLPSIISMVVIALIFTHLYARDGYVNLLFQMTGLPFPEKGWLLESDTALASIMAMDVWMSTGYYMVLFLAALQNIPKSVYESADLAGAGPFQKFRYLTLPLLRPMLLFVVVINTIKSFQIFTEIFVMTKGGPLNSTVTVVYSIYDFGLKQFQMGYASAMAYVLFVIILLFSLLQMRVLRFGKSVEE